MGLVAASPAAAQQATRGLTASANGATVPATEIADPAAPLPTAFQGQLAGSGGTVIDLTWDDAIESGSVSLSSRDGRRVNAPVGVEPVGDRAVRVTLPLNASLPSEMTLVVEAKYDGANSEATSAWAIGVRHPGWLFGVTQKAAGAGPTLDLEARAAGRVNVTVSTVRRGKARTVGSAVWTTEPRRWAAAVPLSSRGKALLKKDRKLKAIVQVTFTAASGAPVSVAKQVTLRAKR